MLRDRLKKLSQQQNTVQETQAETCLVFESRYPLLPETISTHALRLLFQEEAAQVFSMEGSLFLDTETTGLSTGTGTVAFLVGVGTVEENAFVVRQYLMRDYPQEENLLENVARQMRNKDILFSYNGRTFDVPLLRTRFIMTGLRSLWSEKIQGDLLYPARRIFRRRLLDCSLGNIEREILGVQRTNDLPGALVPARYNAFLKTQNMALLDDILRHNRQDIYSLYLLLHRMADIMEHPGSLANSTDRYSLALHFQKRGEQAQARKLLEQVQNGSYFGKAQRTLSMLYRREGAQDEAIEILKNLARRGLEGAFPFIELAKIYEHQKKDYDMALKITEYALAHADLTLLPALMVRRDRLLHKKKAQTVNGGNNHG